MIRLLTEADIPAWISIIREVEPLFGPMVDDPNFLPAIREAIRGDAVYCHGGEATNGIDGVIVIQRETNAIEWLAVSEKAKKGGIGSKLLEKGLAELDADREITVQTFAAEVASGAPARRLYEKYGFADAKDAGKNPAGIPTVIMTRRKG